MKGTWTNGRTRYTQVQVLGTGASGVVVEVVDVERGDRLALKSLRRDTPLDVARLQREFRSLADVTHPHVVRLHEMGRDEEGWFYTMDLVVGRTLRHWVWDSDARPEAATITGGHTWNSERQFDEAAALVVRPPLTPALLRRLRRAMEGVVLGLLALHDAGILHRDVKPSNVMVREDGHALLVDFGLAVDRAAAADGRVTGTAAYMAPEQAASDPVSEASDWYAIGAMLFELLTGRTPFVGSVARILVEKQWKNSPSLAEIAPDAPADLVGLAMALLARRAADRPSGAEVCAVFGLTVPKASPAPPPFVGRHEELDQLRALASGSGVSVVHVCGPSGLGKSRLVRRHTSALTDEVLVLESRCYERERSPFKAIDPLLHALADTLKLWPGQRVDRVWPDHGESLVRMFPSLQGVIGSIVGPSIDAQTERRAAFRALRDLLLAVAQEVPLVCVIDDLQWGDIDSARALRGVFESPAHVPLTFVLIYRTADAAIPPILEAMAQSDAEVLEVAPLSQDAAAELATRMLDDTDAVDAIVRQAKGSPFFVAELARSAASGASVDLQQVVEFRVRQLEVGARVTLEAVAVAGRPMDPARVLAAARSEVSGVGQATLSDLMGQQLLTTRRGDHVECSHDRIREVVVATLSEVTLRARHRALAEIMGDAGDPELRSEHWEHAGETARAAELAREAAEASSADLALDRAVRLYRRSLRLVADTAPERPYLLAGLGRALAKVGDGSAADVLLEASVAVDEPQATEALKREAVNQLFRSGRFEAARELLPEVLSAVGLRWPRYRGLAIAELALDRLGLRWPTAPNPRALEVAIEMNMSLAYDDLLRAGVFSVRAIRLAEAQGDPTMASLAASMRASSATLLGDLDQGARFMAQAEAGLPPQVNAVDRARVELHFGIVDTVRGDNARGADRLDSCAAAFVAAGDRPYELGMSKTFQAFALAQLGRLSEFKGVRQAAIDDAYDRGDRLVEALFRVSFVLQPGIIDDDMVAAEANLARAASVWPSKTGTITLYRLLSEALLCGWKGAFAEGVELLVGAERVARREGLLSIVLNQGMVDVAMLVCAGPLVDSDPAARKLVDRTARRVQSAPDPPRAALGGLLMAALQRGDPAARIASLRRAASELEALDLVWFSAVARAALARASDGDPAAGHEVLAACGVADPEHLERWLVPP